MLPSLVAEDLRDALTSFLGTTFALADDDVRAELERFVADPHDGVFRGPFVRLRLPFRPADDGWRQHLDWAPPGFVPHRHQAQAWMRLASRDRPPQPTLVTTGTGSGKTESFLVPLLDHCRRERLAGRPGIKALVLYPMNALANDQARRIARLVHGNAEALGDLRVGLYTGDATGGAAMSETAVIGDRYAMRQDPPDILLTNYKMLDMLLLRREDVPLFAGAGESLRYLVLDEFHTYDGAQGTDVAMLLRRLGMALGLTTDDRPLGAVTPVATSATLGGGAEGGPKLRDFARTVFGTAFDEDALVGEDRLTAAEWAGPEQGTVPLLDDVTAKLDRRAPHEDQLRAGARLFGPDPRDDDLDPQVLGRWLRAHPFTHRLLASTAQPVSLVELADRVEPSWTAAGQERRTAARHALALFLALLARARDGARPLLGVDVQLWVREVSRMLRRLDGTPGFRWHEGAAVEDGSLSLPSVFCRHCGRSGWGVVATAGGSSEHAPTVVWNKTAADPSVGRAWIHAPGEAAQNAPEVMWADPETADLQPGPQDGLVPVVVTPDGKAAHDGQCPSCGQRDGIRFLGSRVATLASVTLGQLFGSRDVAADEKKTLVFTDSVQDASHRAAFVERRAYALNLRALLHRAVGDDGCWLSEVGAAVERGAADRAERYAVLPPDLREHRVFDRFWKDAKPDGRVRRLVVERMAFAATLEFGLSSRTGRTLELTGAVDAHVHVEDIRAAVRAALDAVTRQDVQLTLDGSTPERTVPWARGIVERIRTQGGVAHKWLARYAREDDRWSIWGGRPRNDGVPAFPSGRPAPAFPTSARHAENLDVVVGARSWYARWTARALGVPPVDGARHVLALFDALVADGALVTLTGKHGTVWQIPADRVRLSRTGDRPSALRCGVCATRFPGPDVVLDELTGAPCHRAGCPGTYLVEQLDHDYYRDLYRGEQVRRIVAREHTSLLPAAERVELENAFKAGRGPAVPNVLTCTPTLELGIDIGDLSVVALTSLPRSTASYLQRVGRAGRLTGNALIVSLLPARPLELQRLADPLTMIAGEVVPPACYLDATEILRRQYLASLVDRQSRTAGSGQTRLARDVFAGGLAPGSWLRRLLDDAREHAGEYVDAFLRGFGETVRKESVAELRRWAGDDLPDDADDPVPALERAVETAAAVWLREGEELADRLSVLQAEITRTEERPSLDEAGERDLKRLHGEMRGVRRARGERERQYWISALEAAGLLPNYALLDDSTRLDVGLWWTDEESGEHRSADEQYVRGSRTALAELAPGATFYVRGTSVEIDGLEVGTARNPATVVRRFCPDCGWSGRAEATASLVACPRCGAAGAADSGQLLTTLPFRRASAYASREHAMRDDDLEDRRRTRFTVLTTVDADPADVTAAWALDGYPFGAEVLRAADVRWVNLGPADRGGAARTIAGADVAAPLFDTCTTCGVVPAAQRGVTGRADARHRGWCRQRREPSPDGWTTVALTHELRTQAVRLLVPPIAVLDGTTRVSFRAALLLGLREVLGGDPDHLDVVEATDPVQNHGERWVMVLHDLVPGGTGYLARFGEAEQVRDLLARAVAVLRRCPCREEGLAACHRCLLPHVPPYQAGEVRRDAAVALLDEVLRHWVPRSVDGLRTVVVTDDETPIEQRFRHLLARWARSRGATVTVRATTAGDSATIHLPAALGGGRWSLTPQVKLGGVMPDFVLAAANPHVPRIAVFCDSRRWHCSREANRLADDAHKRAGLRDRDYLVWAVTHHDLDAFAVALTTRRPPSTTWAADELLTRFRQVAQQRARPGAVRPDALLGDAMSVLTAFVLHPSPVDWQGPALVLAAVQSMQEKPDPIDPGAVPARLRVAFGEPADVVAGSVPVSVCRSRHGAVLALERRSPADVRPWVAVDDTGSEIGTPDQVAAWHDWLGLSNVLQFVGSGRFHAHTRTGLAGAGTAPAPVLTAAWREIADVSDPSVLPLLEALAAAGVVVPEAGYEADDGEYLIDLAWPGARVAVTVDDDGDGRDAWLAGHGWTVLPPDPAAVRSALEGAC